MFTGQDIKDGQNVWQSLGGQELGSIWGHGSYVAPDWSADWLHRESVSMLNQWSNAAENLPYDKLNEKQQAQLKARLKKEMKTNTYDPSTDVLTISETREKAISELSK